jgi:hypothetical protein
MGSLSITHEHIRDALLCGACKETRKRLRPGMTIEQIDVDALLWVEQHMPELARELEVLAVTDAPVPIRGRVPLWAFGHGEGHGEGHGNGYGFGFGDGDGFGSGHGEGHGEGHGNGDGYGFGFGDGDGFGFGFGSGYGYGYVEGAGNGYGNGYVDGDGDGLSVLPAPKKAPQ